MEAEATMRISAPVKSGGARGAEVVLVGDHYAEAQAHCDELAAATGMTFVHPFDDLRVIAGQGTLGLELAAQLRAAGVSL